MVSKYDPGIKPESAYRPIERWLRKLFRWESREIPVDPNIDRRDFYRLDLDPQQPLDLCLTMQDERVFCTTIRDMSASGFGCYIKGLNQIQGGQPFTALFALPLEEPVIIKSEVYLVSIERGTDENGDVFRFRYSEEIKDDDRDLIHRYIVQQQFEFLERNNPKNLEHDDDDNSDTLIRD
jgi:c-di-GMP-binding flagellar brake protein YcgR